MAFDSEEKKSDFAAWAEDMTYEEERELKRQEKERLKEEKKAEKAAKRKKKKSGKGEDGSDSSEKDDKKDSASEEKSETSKDETSKDEAAKDDSSEKETSKDEPAEKENADGESSEDKAEEEEEYNPDYKKVKKKKDADEVNIVKELLSLIIYIGVVIILCYCIITYVGQRTTVNGQSMENTLQDGDNLWIDKFTYHFKDPKRFDVIVFPYEDDVYYIKRIIGLPGETVQITSDGNIFINGNRLSESYGKEIIADPGTASEERVLGEDEYFVLGDNRNDSRDSRWADVGNIDREDIIGRAVFRLTPFSKFGKIE